MAERDTCVGVHPGQILREEFLKPVGLTAEALATRIGVPVRAVEALLGERRGMTPGIAIRLARLFQTSSEFWMELQSSYELAQARTRLGAKLNHIEPFSGKTA